MKKFLIMVAAGTAVCATGAGVALADSHEGEGIEPAYPVEIHACSYNEGMGPADLDKASAAWNAWADKHNLEGYSAWTLVPYYFGPEQEFDVLWLGGASNAKTLGRAQDLWLATGGKEIEGFNKVLDCTAHSNFATLRMKTPPERENPGNVVISFSDCNMADGLEFEDMAPALMEWAKYRENHGSKSGMWVLFPAYGGGAETFDFKWVAAWQNLEDQGADYDQYSESGWEKGNELFQGKLSCDSSRVYIATNRRMADNDD